MAKPLVPPTIGRRVYYIPGKSEIASDARDPITQFNTSMPCDAGVVYVFGDRLVNLDVCDHGGKHHFRSNVRLLQAEDALPTDGFSYARWMDYQVQKQAEENDKAKTPGVQNGFTTMGMLGALVMACALFFAFAPVVSQAKGFTPASLTKAKATREAKKEAKASVGGKSWAGTPPPVANVAPPKGGAK